MAIKLFTLPDKTITTAGTRVQAVATSTFGYSIIVQAPTANTNNIYVGDASVSASRGIQVAPGGSISITGRIITHGTEELDISQIWLDSDTNGNKAKISYSSSSN